MTPDGWNNFLYQFVMDKPDVKYNVLWIMIPNMVNHGRIEEIAEVTGYDVNDVKGTWIQNEHCSGLEIQNNTKCEFRFSEMELHQFDEVIDKYGNKIFGFVRLDVRDIKREVAKNSFILVILTIALLFLASTNIGNDTERIMTRPITRMVGMIKSLADDPLRTSAAIIKKNESSFDKKLTTLDNVIIKIGKLIEIGYGTLGSEVLADTMANGDGTLNVMQNGKKIGSIIMMVNIENFHLISNYLQEEITLFLNKIGSLVAECSEAWGGYMNKFYDSDFMVSWRLPIIETVEISKRQEVAEEMCLKASHALAAAIKIIAEFRRAKDIKSYLRNPKLVTVIKHLNINISFHFTWSIEGALSYSKRVEVCYLSPAMEDCLTLSKIGEYLRLSIVMTNDFYNLLHNKPREYIREIGSFKWNGAKSAKALYSFDLNDSFVGLANEEENSKLGLFRNKQKNEDSSHEEVKNGGIDKIETIFKKDADIEGLNASNSEKDGIFKQALASFVTHDWKQAAELFEKLPKDILSNKYIEMINSIKEPGDDWDGSIDASKYILMDPPPMVNV